MRNSSALPDCPTRPLAAEAAAVEPAPPGLDTPLLRFDLSAPAVVTVRYVTPTGLPGTVPPKVVDAGEVVEPLPRPSTRGDYKVLIEADGGPGRFLSVPLLLQVDGPDRMLVRTVGAGPPEPSGPSRAPTLALAALLLSATGLGLVRVRADEWMTAPRGDIFELIARMDALLGPLEERADPNRFFLATYRRTTIAVAEDIRSGGFQDGEWVERWDVVFANLYLDAVEQWTAGEVPAGPWPVAFQAARDEHLPPLRHVLLAINAHINYDLPLSLLAVITDEEFDDETLVARRREDHAHVDGIIASRVDAEDKELIKVEQPGDRTWLDRALTPFNQAGTKRFLKEARRKTWANARLMSAARRQGPEALAARVQELEQLSRRRVADLKVPGQVLLKLAVKGFGVELAP